MCVGSEKVQNEEINVIFPCVYVNDICQYPYYWKMSHGTLILKWDLIWYLLIIFNDICQWFKILTNTDNAIHDLIFN